MLINTDSTTVQRRRVSVLHPSFVHRYSSTSIHQQGFINDVNHFRAQIIHHIVFASRLWLSGRLVYSWTKKENVRRIFVGIHQWFVIPYIRCYVHIRFAGVWAPECIHYDARAVVAGSKVLCSVVSYSVTGEWRLTTRARLLTCLGYVERARERVPSGRSLNWFQFARVHWKFKRAVSKVFWIELWELGFALMYSTDLLCTVVPCYESSFLV